MQYTLLLLLPSADMAWSWVQSAQAGAETLSHGITRLFGEAQL